MPTWIRVRDNITGAEFDVDERAMRGDVTPVEGYPVLTGDGAQPRPDKPYVAKDGRPAMPRPRAEPASSQITAPAQPADTKE